MILSDDLSFLLDSDELDQKSAFLRSFDSLSRTKYVRGQHFNRNTLGRSTSGFTQTQSSLNSKISSSQVSLGLDDGSSKEGVILKSRRILF